jgi:hypothetical protein
MVHETSFQIINIYVIIGQNCDSSKGWYESDMDSEELQGYVRVHAIYVTLLLQLALKHLTSLFSTQLFLTLS